MLDENSNRKKKVIILRIRDNLKKHRRLRSTVKLFLGISILLVTSQCRDTPRSENASAAAPSATLPMLCTKSLARKSGGDGVFLLTKSGGGAIGRSWDCQLAKRLIGKPAGELRVIVKNIRPDVFNGESECDQASPVPPARDGRSRSLSKEMDQLSFESQVIVSLEALSLQKCLSHVFPIFFPGEKLSTNNLSMKSLDYFSRNRGYYVDNLGSSRVLPISELISGHDVKEIYCGRIIYSHGGNTTNEIYPEIYRACLENYSDISAIQNIGDM